jgi:hypothetical protein
MEDLGSHYETDIDWYRKLLGCFEQRINFMCTEVRV